MSLFHVSTCFEHYVLIVRTSKFYYTASGIVTPIGGRPVHGLRTLRNMVKQMVDIRQCSSTGRGWLLKALEQHQSSDGVCWPPGHI